MSSGLMYETQLSNTSLIDVPPSPQAEVSIEKPIMAPLFSGFTRTPEPKCANLEETQQCAEGKEPGRSVLERAKPQLPHPVLSSAPSFCELHLPPPHHTSFPPWFIIPNSLRENAFLPHLGTKQGKDPLKVMDFFSSQKISVLYGVSLQFFNFSCSDFRKFNSQMRKLRCAVCTSSTLVP